jgi:hypothetical protein
MGGHGMTWARFEDHYPLHRKVRPLSDAAFRLHVSAICWCAAHLTDGHISKGDLRLTSDVRNPAKAASELVTAGLWDVAVDGWYVHDYLAYNPPKEKVLARREADRVRQQRGRDTQQVSRRDTQRDTEQTSSVTPLVPSPIPTPNGVGAEDAAAIIAVLIEASTAVGMSRPGQSIIGRVGKAAKQLLASGTPFDDLAIAAKRLGANGWDDLEREVRRVQAERVSPQRTRAVPDDRLGSWDV